MDITQELAQNVRDVVRVGLVRGTGNPVPGECCVEAAVCLAAGEPHGDSPSCVGFAVRAYKIVVNDSAWSDDQARAKGMLRVAIAQLGSNTIDQAEFVKRLAIRNVNTLLADTLDLIGVDSGQCRVASDLSAAKSAAKYAARYAAESAEYAEYAARYAAESAGYAAGYAEYAARDAVLAKACEMVVQILIEMECPGTQFLFLAPLEEG